MNLTLFFLLALSLFSVTVFGINYLTNIINPKNSSETTEKETSETTEKKKSENTKKIQI